MFTIQTPISLLFSQLCHSKDTLCTACWYSVTSSTSRLGTIGIAGIAGAFVAIPVLLISEAVASYGFQIFAGTLLDVTAATINKAAVETAMTKIWNP